MELASIKNAETQRWPAAEKQRSQQGVWRNSKRWLAKIGGLRTLLTAWRVSPGTWST